MHQYKLFHSPGKNNSISIDRIQNAYISCCQVGQTLWLDLPSNTWYMQFAFWLLKYYYSYQVNEIICIIQHLRASLSFDWTIVGHMIFNRWYIARSCKFGYMRRAFLVICRLRIPLCCMCAYPCVYLMTRRQSACNREGLTRTLIYLYKE